MKSHSVAIGMAGVLSLGASAAAQGLRPAAPAPRSGQRADFTVSSTQGYDGRDAISQPEFGGPNQEPTGSSTSLSVAGNYAWLGRWAQVSANGALRLQQYHSIGRLLTSSTTANRSATLGVSKKWGRNTFSAGQTGVHSSAAVLSFFPQPVVGDETQVIPAVARDVTGNNLEMSSYGTGVTYARQVAARSSLRITTERQQATTVSAARSRQSLVVYGVGNQFSRTIQRHVALTFAYGYRQGNVGSSLAEGRRNSSEHTVDIGVDWTRPLSATRRITASGRIGGTTSIVPQTIDAVVVDRRLDRFSSQLSFGYGFGRSWQTRASYRRGVEYIAGLDQPVFSDTIIASVGGLITRRLDATVAAAYSSGASATNRDGLIFDTYTGNMMLRFAVTRTLAAFAEYVRYSYETRGPLALAPGFPRQLDRQTVRAGLMLNVRPFWR